MSAVYRVFLPSFSFVCVPCDSSRLIPVLPSFFFVFKFVTVAPLQKKKKTGKKMVISAILFCFYGRGVAVPAALPTTIQSSADNRRRRRRHRRRDVASAVRRRHRRSSLTAPGEIPFFLPSSFFFLSFCFSLSFFSFFFLYILHRKFGRWRRYFFLISSKLFSLISFSFFFGCYFDHFLMSTFAECFFCCSIVWCHSSDRQAIDRYPSGSHPVDYLFVCFFFPQISDLWWGL